MPSCLCHGVEAGNSQLALAPFQVTISWPLCPIVCKKEKTLFLLSRDKQALIEMIPQACGMTEAWDTSPVGSVCRINPKCKKGLYPFSITRTVKDKSQVDLKGVIEITLLSWGQSSDHSDSHH